MKMMSLAVVLTGYLFAAYDQPALSNIAHHHHEFGSHARSQPIGDVWLYVADSLGAAAGLDPVAIRCPAAQRTFCWSLKEGAHLRIDAQLVSFSSEIGAMALVSEVHGTKVTALPAVARVRPAAFVLPEENAEVSRVTRRLVEINRQLFEVKRRLGSTGEPCGGGR